MWSGVSMGPALKSARPTGSSGSVGAPGPRGPSDPATQLEPSARSQSGLHHSSRNGPGRPWSGLTARQPCWVLRCGYLQSDGSLAPRNQPNPGLLGNLLTGGFAPVVPKKVHHPKTGGLAKGLFNLGPNAALSESKGTMRIAGPPAGWAASALPPETTPRSHLGVSGYSSSVAPTSGSTTTVGADVFSTPGDSSLPPAPSSDRFSCPIPVSVSFLIHP
jgi:hypothetical protein